MARTELLFGWLLGGAGVLLLIYVQLSFARRGDVRRPTAGPSPGTVQPMPDFVAWLRVAALTVYAGVFAAIVTGVTGAPGVLEAALISLLVGLAWAAALRATTRVTLTGAGFRLRTPRVHDMDVPFSGVTLTTRRRGRSSTRVLTYAGRILPLQRLRFCTSRNERSLRSLQEQLPGAVTPTV